MKLTSSVLSTLSVLLCASQVSAHGFTHQMIIDGKAYIGNAPNADPNPSPLRQVSDVGPVKGASNPDVNCGLSAQPASQVASANPGSTVQFDWRGGDLSHWPHNTGPIMTYMASCGDTTCDKFNPQSAQWFLIDRQGQYSNGSWIQSSLMNNALVNVQIPSNIAPGNYMIRNEIIALHLAVTMGGAEFYPSCGQLQIGGSGTGKPAQSDLVKLPGAYKDTDPGIFDPNVFNEGATYTFPGPNIASFITGSSPSGSNSTNTNSTSSGNGSGNSGKGSGSSGSGTCRLRRKTSSTASSNSTSSSSSSDNSSSSSTSDSGSGYRKRAIMYHRRSKPRSFSRVMRSMFFGENADKGQ